MTEKQLRITHLHQLIAYMEDREDKGWYYGNKEQFEKRHKELKEWIEKLIYTKNSLELRKKTD